MIPSRVDIAVIGGGPAGSLTARFLANSGYEVCLVERRSFPRETLCGEFISHEVLETLKECGLDPEFHALRPAHISKVKVCPIRGRAVTTDLGFTAFGVQRGVFDRMLLESAKRQGVQVIQPADAEEIVRSGDRFSIHVKSAAGDHTVSARWCVGAYGKSGALDKKLGRGHVAMRSGVNGVKVHVPVAVLSQCDPGEVVLFSGRNMYCGLNIVNDGVATLCYLERRTSHDLPLRARFRELAAVNPGFAAVMTERGHGAIASAAIHGTGNIFFGRRDVVHNGMFMVGDAARVIAPLAGDGIGMAAQGARILGSVFGKRRRNAMTDDEMARDYERLWSNAFAARVRHAYVLQKILLSGGAMRVGGAMLRSFPGMLGAAVRFTRSQGSSL